MKVIFKHISDFLPCLRAGGGQWCKWGVRVTDFHAAQKAGEGPPKTCLKRVTNFCLDQTTKLSQYHDICKLFNAFPAISSEDLNFQFSWGSMPPDPELAL